MNEQTPSSEPIKYLDVAAAAGELGITPTSFYKIVNHVDPAKRLEPVNRNTHRGDGGFRFRLEDINRIKPQYVKNDLTSAEAANRLGRSTTFIHKLIRDGVLDYYETEFRGKRTFFIKESELARYMSENPDSGKSEAIYDKRSGLFLYQPFSKDDQLARVVKIKRVSNRKIETTLRTESEQLLSYDEAIALNWAPAMKIQDRKPTTSYGYAVFHFPLPRSLDSMIFTIIEEFFKQVGPANMKISAGEQLVVEVKKSVLVGILPTTHPDMIDKLKLFLLKGEIIPKYDGTLIDTGLSPITFYLPEEKKAELVRLAAADGISLQEWIEKRLD
ncbi:helix-turn-helix domain-containing protein [Paenibacillus abyssi]